MLRQSFEKASLASPRDIRASACPVTPKLPRTSEPHTARARVAARIALRPPLSFATPSAIEPLLLVLENIDVRAFLAIFSVADLYLGPNAAGAHVAAAFDVPSIVILNQAQYAQLPSFPDSIDGNQWRHESFLYPYHCFLLA